MQRVGTRFFGEPKSKSDKVIGKYRKRVPTRKAERQRRYLCRNDLLNLNYDARFSYFQMKLREAIFTFTVALFH